MKLEFHHINFVSKDVEMLYNFYIDVLQLDKIPMEKFPRSDETDSSGFSGKIRFVTEGSMQMHLAEQDFHVAFKNSQTINPVEKGHIAFRTDDLKAFLEILEEKRIPYSDYGTAFAKEWHQVFFQDPAGNIVEVHQKIK